MAERIVKIQYFFAERIARTIKISENKNKPKSMYAWL